MKKKSILNLIRCHMENNDAGFRAEARQIAHEFDSLGDAQLADYVMSLLSTANSFVPQAQLEVRCDSPFLEKMTGGVDMIFLPDAVTKDIIGIVNAVKKNIGTNKFLFQGKPGTGKTQAAIQVARLLERDLFQVNESALVDSKLGQTQKNIAAVFQAVASVPRPDKVALLFDELDAIALDRTIANDLREMGRATTEVLKGLDRLPDEIVLIAPTNLFQHFDKALTRRFDYVVNFDRYSDRDLGDIAEKMLDRYLDKVKLAGRDVRLFRKILRRAGSLPSPGELRNIIKTAVAFSDPGNGLDYMHRLYSALCGNEPMSLKELQGQGFTIREIGVLAGQSKSGVGRELGAKAL